MDDITTNHLWRLQPRVLTCFQVFFFLHLVRRIKLSALCFPGAASAFKYVEEGKKVLTPKSV